MSTLTCTRQSSSLEWNLLSRTLTLALIPACYCSRICVCEYSVYTNVNMNVSIGRIALNQQSVQQASVDIRASSAYEQEKASLFF